MDYKQQKIECKVEWGAYYVVGQSDRTKVEGIQRRDNMATQLSPLWFIRYKGAPRSASVDLDARFLVIV